MNIFQEFFEKLRDLVDEFALSSKDRALSMPQIYEMVYNAFYDSDITGWLSDLYRNDNGEIFGVAVSAGKLYKFPIAISGTSVEIGEVQEVEVEFAPVAQPRTIIRETGDGKYRWLSVSCTSVLNKEAQIDSRDLFDSFVQHATETGDYPYRTFWHKGRQFRTGQCDFLARDGYVLVTSGLYDDSELARREVAARKRDPEYWGESVQFLPTAKPEIYTVGDGIEIPVYREGILEEISNLPEESASSLFTNKTSVKEVSRAMKPREFKALVALFDGDEEAAKTWLAENVDETNRSIKETGAIARDTEDPELTDEVDTEETETEEDTLEETEEEEETSEGEEPEVESVEESAYELDEDAVAAIAHAVTLSDAFSTMRSELQTAVADVRKVVEGFSTELTEMRASHLKRMKDMGETIEELQKPHAEMLEREIADLPRSSRKVVSYRPSKPNGTEEEGAEETLEDIAQRTLSTIK